MVVAKLEVSLLLLANRVLQLVLVKIQNFLESSQVGSQRYEFGQVDCRAEQDTESKFKLNIEFFELLN